MSEDWDNSTSSTPFGRNKPFPTRSYNRSNRGNRYDKRDEERNSSSYRGNMNERNDQSNRTFNNFFPSSEENGSVKRVIQVDTRKLGSVIGVGGSNIKELEQLSSTRILVDKHNRAEFTNITIQGVDSNVTKACQLIEECTINDNYNSRPNDRNTWGSQSRSSANSNQFDRRNQRYDRRNDGYSSNASQDYGSSNNNYSSNFTSDNTFDERNQFSTQYKQQNESSSVTVTQENEFQPIDWQALYEESEKQAAAKLAAMPPIIKNLYEEDPEIANMSPEEANDFRKKNMEITVCRVFGENEEEHKPIPNPVKTFEQAFRPYPEILQTIYDQNFTAPSPIQSQAWPIILSGEDMIGIAQTGTGKTLAFLLPALIHIEKQITPRHERGGPSVIILSPTRELALQIEKEINKYSYRNIQSVCVYGGSGNRNNQMKSLMKKPEIVVATPGRLEDFIGAECLNLDSVTYVVLDEADKMLEMGFECQIRRVLLKIRGDRHTIMTSATWPIGVRRLASQYSKNPVQVVVGSLDLTAAHSVSQDIQVVTEEEKRDRLTQFLAQMDVNDKVIVFCGKKSVTDDIASDLLLQGVKCQSLHGDREQCDREQALQDLKSGEVHILIATDVAARGIDIADITHIFNYDFPKNIEEYVHRIGRSGRAGKTGASISLITRKDWANAPDLIKILNEANQEVPEALEEMAKRFEKKKSDGPRGGRGGRGNRSGGFNRSGGQYNRY